MLDNNKKRKKNIEGGIIDIALLELIANIDLFGWLLPQDSRLITLIALCHVWVVPF
jgi:hypothetical protein